MQSTSSIKYLHGLIIELHAYPKTTSGVNILCGENTNGNLSGTQIYLIFQSCTFACFITLCQHIIYTHTTITSAQIGKEYPFGILTICFVGVLVSGNRVFLGIFLKIKTVLNLKS
ncbi:hypothetical protein SDC9_86654 [bioreactor metagenome]|uniref:Uncharacterized protein n=1 Tax=bioreactor metagenome TaxID=1076179 RepID=A0A644ZGP9_9ZZZZ